MPSKYVHTEVKGRKLKLSNLDKILYPSVGVTKAEVIQYALTIGPYLLKYLAGRPLTLIRYPDGVGKKQFYSKSKPDWTPDWIDSIGIQHSEEVINYIIANDEATIVWLANLAALEVHPMQMTKDKMDHPDHFIFDLDPPENGDFEIVKEIALKLKGFLANYGYKTYVKTSGSKGLHVFVPLVKNSTHEEMVDAVKKIARVFVNQNKETSTLAMSKEKRDGKTLIDIFRNHMAHTTVSAYSLRGKEGAPISFPIPWEVVPDLKSSKDIHIRNYNDYLNQFGDAWDNFYTDARPLHTQKEEKETIDPAIKKKLSTYVSKRDFELTPEPSLAPVSGSGNQFCIQLHDAQNLHYDLRLENEGVLMSWAIPKGLPFEKGIKRLAIRTEDHPMKYLTFEGVIPQGQYGAGEMWIFTKGEIEWIEKTDKKYKFKLVSKDYNRSFKMYRTRDQQWLIELEDNFDFPEISMPLKPMLAGVRKEVPLGVNYIYEIKWDGIRTILLLNKDTIKIFSRSGRDITKQFPELANADHFDVESGIFDGEIVNLDEQGRPIFSNVISRMHSQGAKAIENGMTKYPVTCYLFDCLMLDGKHITKEPLHRRQAWLKTALKKGKPYRMSEAITDGNALFEAAKQMQLEGIMAKDKNGKYELGQRSDNWLKVKFRSVDLCLIAGYTKGQGDRVQLFGALHVLKQEDNGELKYMGKVGTGFDSKKMKRLLELFENKITDKKQFIEKTDDDHTSVWLIPTLKCEIQYASLSSNGTYREPVFIKLIEEK